LCSETGSRVSAGVISGGTLGTQLAEGQFDIVVREEKAQILEAFEKLSTENRGPQPYRPLVAIIICGKRHNAKYNIFIPLYPQKLNIRR
jgi:hypothetical protein